MLSSTSRPAQHSSAKGAGLAQPDAWRAIMAANITDVSVEAEREGLLKIVRQELDAARDGENGLARKRCEGGDEPDAEARVDYGRTTSD